MATVESAFKPFLDALNPIIIPTEDQVEILCQKYPDELPSLVLLSEMQMFIKHLKDHAEEKMISPIDMLLM